MVLGAILKEEYILDHFENDCLLIVVGKFLKRNVFQVTSHRWNMENSDRVVLRVILKEESTTKSNVFIL